MTAGPYDALVDGMAEYAWEDDPRRLGFTMARYKFVAKMFEGFDLVLEVGCADGFFSRVVKQAVSELDCIDSDLTLLKNAKVSSKWPINFYQHDILESPIRGFDGVFCLDVFEHIKDEDKLLENLRLCAPACIIGTPSLESQAFASKLSVLGHVNCKTGSELKKSMQKHWKNVFLFGMNDETLHTGFSPMSHYLLAIGVA